MTLNMYAHNNRLSDYVKQKLIEMQEEIDKSTTISGDFNTPLLEMNRSSRQKINRHIIELNNTINQLDVTDIS